MRRARVVRHAGLAWAAAIAGAWLVAASCRSTRELPAPSLDPGAIALAHDASHDRPIRVGVRVGVPESTISAAGGVRVRGEAAGEDVLLVRFLRRATFAPAAEPGRVRLVETGEEFARARVRPVVPSSQLAVDGSPYRGHVEVLPADASGVTVVNVVPLEQYLRGVVPNELAPEEFPQLEALKAQAVAARSYVLAHLGDYSSRGYDVCATAACQVYRGTSSEHPLTDRAVAETLSTVATWRGRPIHAYYTSTCGGHTEEGAAVLDDGAPYLRGVVCPTEQASGDAAVRLGRQWQKRLRPEDVERGIARYGSVGRVLDLVPMEVGVSGRVLELEVRGQDGELTLRGLRVQQGLGLRETLFVLHRETGPDGRLERFVITGKGWGHGVGLCQVGAAGMARDGATFDQILKHYYTGVTVASLDSPTGGGALGAP